MKKVLSFTLFFVLISAGIMAQTLGEFKPKDSSYGLKKINNTNKIFIAGFDVNYQVYNEKEEFKQGGSMLGGGMKGDAKTAISVGLEGLDEKTVQEITDQLYEEYVTKLKAKGLTIISADEAAKTEAYEGFTKVKGGKVSMAQLPGVMATAPSSFEYFIKKVDKDGKEKKGGFLGNDASKYPKLSKDLGDAIIGNVEITVLFVQDQNAFQGNGAKLKVKTNLRIISTEAIVMTLDAKVKFKGQNSVTTVTSNVGFYHGKMGAGATSAYIGTLGKPIAIDGVIEDTKLTSYASGGMTAGTPTIYGTFYSVRNGNTKNAKIINVDPVKYKEGVLAGASKFLGYHTDAFLKELD
ncbi:MAG TPA: hypothetical protein VD884_14890 [Ohtaekwangia sp.]|nr:hypothetical protein [Ohtaekwangia sp.]